MQHLGALLLELGRTLLTLRMGQTPVCSIPIFLSFKFTGNCLLQLLPSLFQAEAIVNAGPAVYISPSGPNPIMVQVCQCQIFILLREI